MSCNRYAIRLTHLRLSEARPLCPEIRKSLALKRLGGEDLLWLGFGRERGNDDFIVCKRLAAFSQRQNFFRDFLGGKDVVDATRLDGVLG